MILIANADDKMRNFLASMIRDQVGRRVLGVGTVAKARQYLHNDDVSLVALSLNLPDMDGLTFLKELREKQTKLELPIVVLSGSSDRNMAAMCFQAGANDFIAMPFNPTEAMARLRNQIALKLEYGEALGRLSDTISSRAASDHSAPTAPGLLFHEDATPRDPLRGSVFQTDSELDAPIPCEMPVSLIIGPRTFYCKTIWLSRHHLLALTFESFPPGPEYRVQMPHPGGESIELKVVESNRQELSEQDAGVLKVSLKIEEAPPMFDELIGMFQKAYSRSGVSGLKSVLKGEEPAPLEDPLSSTMIFSYSATSTLNVIEGTRYNFKKEVGRGGFASVYLVEDNALKRPVAMKVLNQEFSRVNEARNNFLHEAQIAAQFHHPNIAFVYEVGEIHEEHYQDYLNFPDRILKEHPKRMIYFTMQYVEGQTVSRWIRAKRNESEDACLEIMIEIVKALAFAHSKDVIHRDIKPDNIMITEQKHVVVTDFGIATRAKATPSPDDSQPDEAPKIEVACTPKYAAPEQLNGLQMDGRSDIYSFGIVAYQMLSGTAPFTGKTLAELVDRQLRIMPQSLLEIRTELNPRIQEIIFKCLQKKPEDRYQNAQELLEDLQAARGDAKEPAKASDEETLDELLNQLLLVTDSGQATRILERLTAFLKIHKTDDNVERIQLIKGRMAEPAVINVIIEKCLNKENTQTLFEFFMELESSRTVLKILHWFKQESTQWKKLALGELAILSAGRDLMPLVVYGLELPDREACLLLKGFGETAPRTNDPIFFKWAEHRGPQTQRELLRILSVVERSSRETLQILEFLAHAGGAANEEIRKQARKLLDERGKRLREEIMAS